MDATVPLFEGYQDIETKRVRLGDLAPPEAAGGEGSDGAVKKKGAAIDLDGVGGHALLVRS